MTVYQEKNKNKLTKDGRSWYFRCYYTDGYGNRKQKESKKYFTKKEALDAEREFLNSLEISFPVKKMTLKDLKNNYLEYKKESVKITSLRDIEVKIKYLEIIDNVIITEFNINHFENWKKSMNEKKLSTLYKNKIYKQFRAILKHAIKYYDFYNLNSILDKMEGFSNPNELIKEMKYFTYEEFMNFQSAYTLHFEMVKYAMEHGYQRYNFYGITGDFDTKDSQYGLYVFKRGFGGEVGELIGEFDLVISPLSYKLFNLAYAMYQKMKKVKHMIFKN